MPLKLRGMATINAAADEQGGKAGSDRGSGVPAAGVGVCPCRVHRQPTSTTTTTSLAVSPPRSPQLRSGTEQRETNELSPTGNGIKKVETYSRVTIA